MVAKTKAKTAAPAKRKIAAVMPKIKDFSKLSIPELERLAQEKREEQERVLAAVAERRVEQLAELREELVGQITESGFEVNEVFPGARGFGGAEDDRKTRRRADGRERAESGMRYVNPSDPTAKVWSGKGRKPGWLADALEDGKKLSDFARP